MNLFKLNARMAVKLGQSLETLYDMEYMEYSYLLNIVKQEIEEGNANAQPAIDPSNVRVNLPDNIRSNR